MCTQVAALTVPDAPGEGDCDAADVPGGIGDLLASLALVLDDVQPAISAAPLQLSATIARRTRSAGRLHRADLVIVSSLMLPMFTQRLTRRLTRNGRCPGPG
jgi:hypothetical protein